MMGARSNLPTLYHFTCDHGRRRIGAAGLLLPAAELVVPATVPALWMGQYVWLTDMARPMREALGLTSLTLSCDRTAHRYRVLDGQDAVWWPRFARALPHSVRESIEGAPGLRPAHWWVAAGGIRAIYDHPLEGGVVQ